MPFDINTFRTQLQQDGARGNLFDVTFTYPAWIPNSGLAGQKMSFMCKAAQLPGATIGIAPLFYFGREVKLAGNRTYQDWTIQIINDEDFVIRNAVELWFNALNDPAVNVRSPNATVIDGGYGVDAIVNQYSKLGGDPIKQYQFVGIWPYDLAPIDLDWQNNDSVEEFAVTFAVQFYGDPTLSDLTA